MPQPPSQLTDLILSQICSAITNSSHESIDHTVNDSSSSQNKSSLLVQVATERESTSCTKENEPSVYQELLEDRKTLSAGMKRCSDDLKHQDEDTAASGAMIYQI